MKAFFAKIWAWAMAHKAISIACASVLAVGVAAAVVVPIAVNSANEAKEPPVPSYTVSFYDGETLLTKKTVRENETPAYTYNPADTAEWDYTFAGWATEQGGEAAALAPATADASYYAVITSVKRQYTLNFAENGGSEVSAITADYGTAVSEPATARDGYVFLGWFTDEAKQNRVQFPYTLQGNATLYADWSEIAYAVSFYDGETLLGTVNVKENATPSYTYDPADTDEWDYTFAGWATEQGGEAAALAPATADASYYAVITSVKKQYTLTFVANGGSDVSAITADYGTAVSEPETARDGYVFLGWFTDEAKQNRVQFPYTLQGNATLYADWSEIAYAISFYDGETLLGTVNVKENATPSYTYDPADTDEWDYTFAGWATEQGGEAAALAPATADASYYAVITSVKKQYTLTFVANGGSDVSAITADYGTSIAAPTAPTREGYRFTGWCADEALQTAASFPITLTTNTTVYAKWNQIVDVKGYLATLVDNLAVSPTSFIPEPMRKTYSKNLVTSVVDDYSDFVAVEDLKKGFGEQWHMILDNITQSETFFTVLLGVEDTVTGSVVAFNNYFDKNPSDTASYNTKIGDYNVTIRFDGTNIYYVLDFTANIPLIGEVQAQIAANMNVSETKKTVRIQLGDANALTYTSDENLYTFAIKYLGVRRAYFSLVRDEDGKVTGRINEYLTVKGVGIKSAADFYIDDTYVAAVGNKGDGVPLMDTYINELYDVKTGEMLGYEVRETKTVSKVSVTFNTLWFDLHDLSGITSIRYHEAENDQDTSYFSVNGSTAQWKSKNVGGLLNPKTLSRRFDIEFRTQYFYRYNTETQKYEEIRAQVPMLFVQEEQMETLSADVKSANSGVDLAVTLDPTYLAKIESDYDTLIDLFIANKADMTEEQIVAIIGDPVSFEEE